MIELEFVGADRRDRTVIIPEPMCIEVGVHPDGLVVFHIRVEDDTNQPPHLLFEVMIDDVQCAAWLHSVERVDLG